MSSGQAAGGGGGAGWKEQLSAIGKMIVDSQKLDGDEKEMVSECMQDLASGVAVFQVPSEKNVLIMRSFLLPNVLQQSRLVAYTSRNVPRGIVSMVA